MKKGHGILCGLFALGLLANTGALAAGLSDRAALPDAMALPKTLLARIDARVIAAIADGDFVAGSYASGELAPLAEGYRDSLLLLRRSTDRWRWESLPMSNSVTAPPEVLRLSAGGETAFVVERLAQRDTGATRIAELAPGRRLFAVSLTDTPAALSDTVELADYPEALDVSPDGRAVAVVSNRDGESYLHLVPFADQSFGSTQTVSLGALLNESGLYASNVAWHPSGRRLAINLNTSDRVLFLALERGEDNAWSVVPWGQPVTVGRDPFVGRFTPDGRYYITSDWGRDFSANTLATRLPQQPSGLSVVRLAEMESTTPRHRVVDNARSGLSAEGLAVSPDGRFVATINMRGTPFPEASPRFHDQASISLFRFDAASGKLAKVGDTYFAGVLPEGGVFDASGNHFLASVFEYREAHGGGIEVFRVADTGLQPVGRIAMPHGVHHVDIAR